MKRFRHRVSQLLVLVVLLNLVLFWSALRLMGWPLVNGRGPGQFIWPHALAIAPDGAVFVAEVGQGQRVQKLIDGVLP